MAPGTVKRTIHNSNTVEKENFHLTQFEVHAVSYKPNSVTRFHNFQYSVLTEKTRSVMDIY